VGETHVLHLSGCLGRRKRPLLISYDVATLKMKDEENWRLGAKAVIVIASRREIVGILPWLWSWQILALLLVQGPEDGAFSISAAAAPGVQHPPLTVHPHTQRRSSASQLLDMGPKTGQDVAP
jgi:hypothetical protein